MASKQKVTVILLVDKVKQRVALAESDSDFIDILFSFLTLPLGTIVRLLNKQSNIGCLDKLYESVENLDVQKFQTEACKTMLLFPQSAAAERCEDLKVNIDSTESNPRNVYVCGKADCCAKATCLGSSVLNARCPHLPLGALIKLQNNKSFLGCVDNLYRSAAKVSSDCFKSGECRDILLSPKLASFFGYTGNMLRVDEIAPRKGSCRGCYSCFWNNNIECEASECVHGVKQADFRLLNPKSPEGRTEAGGGYAKGKFLVTTDLCVSQLSASSSLQTLGYIKHRDIQRAEHFFLQLSRM